MKPLITTLAFLFLFAITADIHGQASKVAIVGGHSDTPDGFSFVAGENLSSGTKIYFTHEEYDDASGYKCFTNTGSSCGVVGEGILEVEVSSGGLNKGDIVRIIELSTPNTFSVDGNVSVSLTGSWSMSSYDCLYAFSASNSSSPDDNVTQIHSTITFDNNFNAHSDVGDNPSSDYPRVISIHLNADNGDYNRDRSLATDTSHIENISNWTTSNSGITLSTTSFTGTLALPIKLIHFTGKYVDDEVLLNWKTASELDNDYFEIEKMQENGRFFSLGIIEGMGTSNEVNEYYFLDPNPTNGTNRYRLKQVDYDGITTYSDIIRVTTAGRNVGITNLYPNPAVGDVISFDVLNNELDELEIEVLNSTGQVMHSQKYETGDAKVINIPLESFEPGTYFARIKSGYGTTTERFLVGL